MGEIDEIPEVACPSCGEPVLEGVEFCPACFASMVGGPQAPGTEPEPEAERVAVAPASATEGLVDPATPRCPEHPERPIAATCERCGRFLCVDCEPDLLRREAVTCRRCRARVKLADAPARIRRIVVELAVTYLGLGLLIFFFVTLMPLFLGLHQAEDLGDHQEVMIWALVGFGLLLSLPFVVAGGVLIFTRSSIAAWVGFALSTVLAGLLAVVALLGGPALGLLLLPVAVLALLRCLELGSLERLRKRDSTR